MAKLIIVLGVTVLLLACQNLTNINPNHSNAQDNKSNQTHQSQVLYYFQKDNLVGVKDDEGKVIIKPEYSNVRAYDYHFAITTPYIEVWGKKSSDNFMDNYPKDALAYPAGMVFDRQGNFLYRPLAFDNGFDYWQEGVRRYVNDKAQVGFVDEVGNIIIPASYQFVSPFNYGYALVHTGNWQRHYADNGDYLGIRAFDKTAKTYFINKYNEKVEGYDKPKHPKDMFYEGKYYPYPFKYTTFEQTLLDKLAHLQKDSYLEITQKPSAHFPYYRINSYDKKTFDKDWGDAYLVSASGQVFKIDSFGEMTPILQLDFYDE